MDSLYLFAYSGLCKVYISGDKDTFKESYLVWLILLFSEGNHFTLHIIINTDIKRTMT